MEELEGGGAASNLAPVFVMLLRMSHLVLLHDAPAAPRVGVCRGGAKDDHSGATQEGAIGQE